MKVFAKETNNHHFVTKNAMIQASADGDQFTLYGNESNCLFLKTDTQFPGVTPLTFYFSEAKRIAESLNDLEDLPTPRECYLAIQTQL